MPFTLPDDLAPELYPLAWLVGRWQGDGTIGYPGIEESAIAQVVEFRADGGPYLTYTTSVYLPGDEPQLWHTESGYWRLTPADDADTPGPAGQVQPRELEVLIADPAGAMTIYLGQVAGPRIDLASDLVARTPSAARLDACRRMYGLVESDLLWVWDMAAFGEPMQSYMAARLHRMPQEAA